MCGDLGGFVVGTEMGGLIDSMIIWQLLPKVTPRPLPEDEFQQVITWIGQKRQTTLVGRTSNAKLKSIYLAR